ncbi:MAG: hypothetical protein WC728_13950 [Elusimicrobiota bacterium]
MKKVLAAFLCFAVLVPGPIQLGSAALAHAETPSVQPQEAVRFFEQYQVFEDKGGKKDPLRSYVVDEKKGDLTPIGKLLYEALRNGKPPTATVEPEQVQKKVEQYKETFNTLRKLGTMTGEQRQAVEKAIEETRKKYEEGGVGEVSRRISANISDTFMADALLRAGFDGAAAARKSEPPKLTQINTTDGFVFADKQGIAVEMGKNVVCRNAQWPDDKEPVMMSPTKFKSFRAEEEGKGQWGNWLCGEAGGPQSFDRNLKEQQHKMNDPKTKPACAPEVPETGRYNYQMLQYSLCRVEEQVKLLERGYELDRLVRIAELLGEQYHDDQFLKDAQNGYKLRDALLKRAEASLDDIPFRHRKMYDSTCGGYVTTVLELVDCKLKARKQYMEDARKFLDRYKARVESFKGRQFITEQDIQGLQADEQLVSKYVTQTYLKQQRFHADNQMERLNFEMRGKEMVRVAGESPDYKFLKDALKDAPLPKEVRDAYAKRGEDLARRVQRLDILYDDIEARLGKADHVQGLSDIQGMLGDTQKELAEVGLDYTMFVNTPSLAKVSKKESHGLTPIVTRALARAGNAVSSLWGGDWFDGYLKDRDNMDRYNGHWGNIAGKIVDGDFKGARGAVTAMAPDSIRTHYMVELAQPGDENSDQQRVTAAYREVQSTVGRVAKTHVYTGIGISIAAWSLALAVAAPIASAGLSAMAQYSYKAATGIRTIATAVQAAGHTKSALALRTLAYAPQIAGAVFEHAAIRLATLSAAPDKLYASTRIMRVAEGTMVRFVNASWRIGSFSLLLSGGLSGTMNAGMYGYNRVFGDGNTPYAGALEAFGQGWTQGAQWASGAGEHWWTPAILFVGLPSNAFEGSALAPATNAIASKGLMGNLSSGLAHIPGLGWINKISLQSLTGGTGALGVAGKFGATVLSMADQIAKYTVLSKGAGWAAHFTSLRLNTVDGDNIERRLKRARAAEMRHMQYPYWLLMPVYPAKYEVQAQAQQRSLQGFEEYKKAGELDAIANAAADVTQLPLKKTPEAPLMQKIFNFRWRGETGQHGTFQVTKDMKYEAIRAELPNALAGGKPGQVIDPASVNPLKYYEVSQKEKGMVGRLHITDEVRDQAQILFEQAIMKRPDLAQKILGTSAGDLLQGFGVVRQGVQQEVARILYVNRATLPKAHVAVAERVLGPYLETEKVVEAKAQALLKALHENSAPSAKFQEMITEIMRETQTWKVQQKGTYMDLVAQWRAKTQGAGLTPVETTALRSAFDYIEAVQARFQHFNQVGTVSTRAEGALKAIRTEYNARSAKNPAVSQMFDTMLQDLSTWRGAQADLKAPAGDGYVKTVQGLKDRVREMTGITRADKQFLDMALKEMEAAPYLLRDSKGTGLGSWRPEQFEGLMFFLNSVMADGSKASDIIRTFLLMKTGGGKTMLAFEGLLPIAEADAAATGKQTIFLTVQSNLESQARMEKNAFKKLLTKIEVDTWEGLKGKLAQGKLTMGNKADHYWILGDEMDGAALQPALTIGETTAGITKDAPGHNILKRIGTRMREILHRGPAEVGKRLEVQIRQQQSIIEGMEPGDAQATLQGNTQKLLSMGRELTTLQGHSFTPSNGKSHALQRAQGAIKSLTQGRNAAANSAQVAELQGLVAELKGADKAAAQGVISRVDAQLRQVWETQNQIQIQRVSSKMQALVDSQTKLLGGMDPAKSESFLKAGGEIKQTIADQATIARGDLQIARQQFKDMMWQQRSALVQSEPAGQKTAQAMFKMAKDIRAAGRPADAAKVEAQARRILADASQARTALDANGKQIMAELKSGKAGWEGRVRELVSQRDALVDRTVTKENPIYEIFRSMRNDMYQLYSSKLRVTDSQQVLEQAPGRAKASLNSSGQSLTRSAEKLVQRYRALEAAGGPKAAEAAKLRETAEAFLTKAKAQQTAWAQRAQRLDTMLEQPTSAKHRSLQQVQAESFEMLRRAQTELQSAKVRLDAADPGAKPALEKQVAQLQENVKQWDVRVQSVQKQLAAFEPAQRAMVRTELQTLQQQARTLATEWQTTLSRFEGPEASALRSSVGSMERGWESQLKRLDWHSDRAIEVLQRKVNGVSTPELAARYALKYTGARWALSKLPGLGDARILQPITPSTEGLTRTYAKQLLKAFLNDPFLPPEVRWKMFWSIMPSTLSPKGSWVQTELFNLARGYTDNPGTIRVDNITGKVNVVHNGQWFESMDTPTRRFWELEYGTDLTLPYEHKTIVTMRDFVSDNRNVRFVGFSGTAGKEFQGFIGGSDVRIVGVGSTGAKDVPLKLFKSASGKYQEIGGAMREVRAHDLANVAAGKQADGLLVLSLADSRAVKLARHYLISSGLAKPDEIAMVFSDAELLRLNRPEANVARQMNLDALNTGKVKILMLDTRVGGRGLDLNFKGIRHNPSPADFRGYNRFEMVIVDPQLASEAHFIQAQGRIDLGRIPKGAERNFRMVMDLASAEREPIFGRMMREEPLMRQMKTYPEVMRLTEEMGRLSPDWGVIHRYVENLEAQGLQPELTARYRQTVRRYLDLQQLEIEKSQLRSASVLKDQPLFDPFMHGLTPINPIPRP